MPCSDSLGSKRASVPVVVSVIGVRSAPDAESTTPHGA